MGMQVGSNGPSSVDLLETWRHHASPSYHDQLAIPPPDLASNSGAEVPRCAASNPLVEAFLRERPYPKSRRGDDLAQRHTKPVAPRISLPISLPLPTASCHFSFVLPQKIKQPLNICARPRFTLWHGVKRCRNASDVDGFNTAGLCCKKRRLRADLITSRLSQPYSQPATHILNREGQETGDKRFLKMATTVDMARRIAHLHATSFLRFSIINRVRKRLGLGLPSPLVRADEAEVVVAAANTSTKMPSKSPSLQASSAGNSLRSSVVAGGAEGVLATPTSPDRGQPSSPKPAQVHTKSHACRLSKPAALPLLAADVAATKTRTSPRIYPVQSPELRPSPAPLDDLEEDSFAFLHPNDDDWDDGGDDPEGVYSDFSVIFGQGTPGPEPQDERTYEEYLDELDGLCWVTR
ncbi:hypothetical protein G7046_g451 [Stylonectria norvegica]|nr:hypothetical protein G7046_g451 [Stylonectria norvegica]